MHERIDAYEIMHAFTLRGAQPSFIALAESRFPQVLTQVLKQVLKQVLGSRPNLRRPRRLHCHSRRHPRRSSF